MKTHEKIQQAVIKAACNRETKGRRMEYRYGFINRPGSESDLAIVNEIGTALYIIPREYNFIDTLYAFNGQSEMNVTNILAGAKEASPIKLTLRLYEKDGMLCCTFENKEGEEIRVDSKLLKTFNPTKEYTYTGSTKTTLVYVYDEYQDLIGCLSPIRYW